MSTCAYVHVLLVCVCVCVSGSSTVACTLSTETKRFVPFPGYSIRRETPKLTSEEVDEKMKAVPLWKLNGDKTAISRSFTAKNWLGWGGGVFSYQAPHHLTR